MILTRRAPLPIPESCFHLPPTAPLYGKPPGCPLLLRTLSPLPLALRKASQHVHAGIMPSYRSMCAYPLRITCRAHFPFEALRFTPCCLAFRRKHSLPLGFCRAARYCRFALCLFQRQNAPCSTALLLMLHGCSPSCMSSRMSVCFSP